MQAFRKHAVATGRLSDANIDAHCTLLSDPTLVAVNSPLISVWGRRP